MRTRLFAIVVVVATLAALGGVARAHQTSMKYVDLALAEGGAAVDVAFTLAPGDVVAPLGLPPDAQPTLAAAVAHPGVPAYVAGWLRLATDDGAACAAGAARAAPDADGKFVVVTWRATCAHAIAGALRVDFAPFFAVDGKHQAIVTLTGADGARGEPAIVRAEQPALALVAGERPSILAWIRYGMDHIYSGRDHIAFVLALLLVVALARAGAGWEVRPLGATLRRTATIITAFTVAHSISLILASLGYVTLPSTFVESAIAVSIAYTAVEDIAKPDVRWRFALTFAFGLVHGLGFASALAELLPPDHVLAPLLAFNVGVELGQLSIVLVALPLLWLLARELGAARYRRTAMPLLASAIFVLGVVWLVERVTGVVLLGL